MDCFSARRSRIWPELRRLGRSTRLANQFLYFCLCEESYALRPSLRTAVVLLRTGTRAQRGRRPGSEPVCRRPADHAARQHRTAVAPHPGAPAQGRLAGARGGRVTPTAVAAATAAGLSLR